MLSCFPMHAAIEVAQCGGSNRQQKNLFYYFKLKNIASIKQLIQVFLGVPEKCFSDNIVISFLVGDGSYSVVIDLVDTSIRVSHQDGRVSGDNELRSGSH